MRGTAYESKPRCVKEDGHKGTHKGWMDNADAQVQWIDPDDERMWIAVENAIKGEPAVDPDAELGRALERILNTGNIDLLTPWYYGDRRTTLREEVPRIVTLLDEFDRKRHEKKDANKPLTPTG